MGKDFSVVIYPKGFKLLGCFTAFEIAALRISDFILGPRRLAAAGESAREDFKAWMETFLT